jgi:signal transduction histidine kinase
MRSLFAKIFAAFFLTVVLIGLLLELTAMRTELRRVDTVVRPIAENAADRAAKAYISGGRESLASELAHFPLPAALLDAMGQPLSSIPPSLEAAARATRDAALRQSIAGFVAGSSFAVQPVTEANGDRYLLVFILPHERWIAILNTLDQNPTLRLSLVGLVAGVVCFLFARHITRPLTRLRATAERMAEGHLEARAGETLARRRDEIGALGRDFDRMADRLQAIIAAERRLLADVSHELRSPLARLNVALALARKHGAEPGRGPAELDLDLGRIEQEAARLDQLIGHALTLARIDSGVEAGPQEVLDLATLIQEVAADGDYEARASGRHVVVGAADPCLITGDIDLVRSAIENIVRNGVRHTAPGTAVDVELHVVAVDGARQAHLTVADRGDGVPDARLQEIFLPFRRGEPPTDGNGAGLGLAIVDRVISMHGGHVSAANRAGGGLVVDVILPLRSPNA